MENPMKKYLRRIQYESGFSRSYTHKAIVGLLAMACMLLISCGDGSAPAKLDLPKLSYTPLYALFGIGESASPQWADGSTEPTATFTMTPAAGGSLPVGIDIGEKTGIVSVSAAAAKQDTADYTVSLTGTGNYIGTATVTISIAVISLSVAELDRGTDEYRGHYGSFSMDSGTRGIGRRLPSSPPCRRLCGTPVPRISGMPRLALYGRCLPHPSTCS